MNAPRIDWVAREMPSGALWVGPPNSRANAMTLCRRRGDRVAAAWIARGHGLAALWPEAPRRRAALAKKRAA